MTRLARPLLRRAKAIDPLLPLLLRACRDLPSARNELRWLREHVDDKLRWLHKSEDPERFASASSRILRDLCLQRSKGKPLQYLLGNQPFGDLEILCRPNVLIPRPETESYTAHLAQLILKSSKDDKYGILRTDDRQRLRVLDLCTGTGCIALLLYSKLAHAFSRLQVRGVDISPAALSLARENLRHNVDNGSLRQSALTAVDFKHGDVLRGDVLRGDDDDDNYDGGSAVITRSAWDVIVSNPPYISRTSFNRETTRSVRNYEPKLALVPPGVKDAAAAVAGADGEDLSGDVFYDRIMATGARAEAGLLVMEVADRSQAQRVIQGASRHKYWQTLTDWSVDLGSVAFVRARPRD